jgi:hypothetical protein
MRPLPTLQQVSGRRLEPEALQLISVQYVGCEEVSGSRVIAISTQNGSAPLCLLVLRALVQFQATFGERGTVYRGLPRVLPQALQFNLHKYSPIIEYNYVQMKQCR